MQGEDLRRFIHIKLESVQPVDINQVASAILFIVNYLIQTGYTYERVNEIGVVNAIEICCDATSNRNVRNVLLSTHLSDPMEVIDTFLTETFKDD